jgi:Domain of unknown function (DUF4376)
MPIQCAFRLDSVTTVSGCIITVREIRGGVQGWSSLVSVERGGLNVKTFYYALSYDSTKNPLEDTQEKLLTEDYVIDGMITENSVYEPQSLEEWQSVLKSRVAAYRYDREIAGLSLNGIEILTDRQSQSKVAEAYILLKHGLITSIDWKSASGWIVLDLAFMEGIATVVGTYIQQCFSAEKEHGVLIDSLTLEEAPTYDIASGWPTTEFTL